jgi:hypothetical protein
MSRHFYIIILSFLFLSAVSQTYVSVDPYNPEQVKSLGLKSLKKYKDSSLSSEYQFDKQGRMTVSKWFDLLGCHQDSMFYPTSNIKIVNLYDNNGKLTMYFKTLKNNNKEINETYTCKGNSRDYILTKKTELHFEKGIKTYLKVIENNKIVYEEVLKYNNGKYASNEITSYDYNNKDSLLNVTNSKSFKDYTKNTHTYTNEKYATYKIGTSKIDTTFDYRDENEELIEFSSDNKPIAAIVFDASGNIIGSNNYIYLNPSTVKKISRTYDVKTKLYYELIAIMKYNDKGLLYKINSDTNYKYEYYAK